MKHLKINNPLDRKLTLGFGISFLILLVSSVISYLSIKELLHHVKQVDQINEKILRLESIFTNILNAESAQRGYLLTKNESFLEHFTDYESKIITDFSKLETIINEENLQSPKFYAFRLLIEERLKSIVHAIELDREKNVGGLEVSLIQGKEITNQTRNLVNAIKEEYQDVLLLDVKKTEQLASFTALVMIVSLILGLTMSGSSFLVIKKDIRKRTETNKKYQLITENSTDFVALQDPNGIYLYVSPSVKKLLGYSQQEMEGQPVYAFCHPDDKEKLMSAYLSIVETSNIITTNARFKHKNGEYRLLESTIHSIKDGNNGAIIEIHSTSRDITERKLNEDKLRKGETLLTELQEIAHVGIYEWDLVNNKVSWSDQLKRLYGYADAPQLFDYSAFKNAVHHEDVLRFEEALRNATEREQPFECEYRIVCPDKSEKFLWSKGKIYLDESACPERLLVSVLDITERKWTDEELYNKNIAVLNAYKKLEKSQAELRKLNNELEQRVEERTKALSLSEARFRALSESIPNMVWTARPDGNVEYYNQRWYEYTGHTEEQSPAYNGNSAIHPEDLPRVMEKWKLSVKTGDIYEDETRFRQVNGQYKWHLVRALPLRDENENIVKWFGTCTDIHEQKEMNAKKDEFIGIASHELKTPLTSIKAYMQLLERNLEIKENTPNEVYIQKANLYIDRLHKLIADLLDVTKIQAGKLLFNMEVFDFDELLTESIETIQNISSNHKIIKQGAGQYFISGDKLRLEQVIINFLSNAIKYSPDSDKVIVNITSDEDEVTVSITDFGIGIPKEKCDKIFDRFYRVEDASHKFTGLGIGLYISSEIVKRHNGKTWAESEEGKGSTFYLVLPLLKTETIAEPNGEYVSSSRFTVPVHNQ